MQDQEILNIPYRKQGAVKNAEQTIRGTNMQEK